MDTDRRRAPERLGGLKRFASTITLFNILGHTVFGFEQSWAHPLAALAAGYLTELLLEYVDARAVGRAPQFAGGLGKLVEFLLPAHISSLAISMLLYPNSRLMPLCFAAAVAIGSKALFRAPVANGTRHFFNPSNFGISITLLLFPWVGVAPPYHFTENLTGVADWALPALILISGSFINARFTGKLPLIAAWLGGFVAQAALRSYAFDTPLVAALLPMTGLAFILYTFYMITDPATTPHGARGQVAFGAAVAGVYGLLLAAHVVFGLFFALTIVSLARGLFLHARALAVRRVVARAKLRAPEMVGTLE